MSNIFVNKRCPQSCVCPFQIVENCEVKAFGCEVKAFGDFHVGSLPVLDFFFFFFVSYISIGEMYNFTNRSLIQWTTKLQVHSKYKTKDTTFIISPGAHWW